LKDLEVISREVRDRLTFTVGHHCIDLNQIHIDSDHTRRRRRLLRDLLWSLLRSVLPGGETHEEADGEIGAISGVSHCPETLLRRASFRQRTTLAERSYPTISFQW
jgi:hypothetical protein